MIISKKIIFIIIVIITTTLIGGITNDLYITSNANTRNPVNVNVLLFNFSDPHMSIVKQSLENIQKENENKVNFTFYDSKSNQAIENATIDNLINTGHSDLLLVNLVNTNENVIEDIISKVKPKNIPIIFFDTELKNSDVLKSYSKAILIATNSKQSGILQGEILVDLWNNNKEVIDKNKDNIMQYIMLQGKSDTVSTIARTTYPILTLNQAGIKTQKLASTVANWNQESAKSAIESLFLKYANNIEVIIANNDAMAIGAVEALQKYYYNKGDPAKTIPVVGVDGIPAAKDLVEKGFMAGTVAESPQNLAKALYTVGMNLVYNRDPLEGTDYKFDYESVILLPFSKFTK